MNREFLTIQDEHLRAETREKGITDLAGLSPAEDGIYACINAGQADCPREIEVQSICIEADIGVILDAIE